MIDTLKQMQAPGSILGDLITRTRLAPEQNSQTPIKDCDVVLLLPYGSTCRYTEDFPDSGPRLRHCCHLTVPATHGQGQLSLVPGASRISKADGAIDSLERSCVSWNIMAELWPQTTKSELKLTAKIFHSRWVVYTIHYSTWKTPESLLKVHQWTFSL
jgi:hypothetical protein